MAIFLFTWSSIPLSSLNLVSTCSKVHQLIKEASPPGHRPPEPPPSTINHCFDVFDSSGGNPPVLSVHRLRQQKMETGNRRQITTA